MAHVYINGKRRQLAPSKVIGNGGEADIYDMEDGTVLKLYKQPNDPAYANDPRVQQAAKERLIEHQTKLPAFPTKLPAAVIGPRELAFNKAGSELVGFTMPYMKGQEVLLRYGDRSYREQGGIDANQVLEIFRNLHSVVGSVHTANVVIGDFNDLNVLVDNTGQVFLVDADSMQFGKFYCRTFTARFLDPLLSQKDQLLIAQPHNTDSDWYAFNTMLMQSLLYVGPYGGVHRPKSGKRKQHDARVLDRITVFDGEVIYPKPALPYDHLPDELLEHFARTYQKDQRGAFPLELLNKMRWTTCTGCGAIHARARCPQCAAPGAVKETIVVRGQVKASRVFRTRGQILHAAFQRGKLRYLYHEDGAFKREDGNTVISGKLDTEFRFRIQDSSTLLGKKQRLLVFDPAKDPQSLQTDTVEKLSMFDANERNHFWIQNGQLVRDGRLGSEFIGTVLPNRTLFWTGNRFGFGFYQAGRLMQSFVFDTRGSGFNDQVNIPALPGQLIDATCTFSDRLAWFMVSLQQNGRIINHCYVIDATGAVLAETQSNPDEESWLASGIRGHFANGSSLFIATDDGIVRVSIENGLIAVTESYPDTEPFVDSRTQLLPGPGGIYAVSARDITLLEIK